VPVALAVDLDLAGAPVEIVEGERGHLPGAQPQACQQQQDGEVPPAMAGAPVAATQQARHLPGLYPPRRQSWPPRGNPWHRRSKRDGGEPGDVQIPQQRAERGHRLVRRRRGGPAALGNHERRDVGGGELLQRGLGRAARQEAACDPQVGADRAGGQSPLGSQIPAVCRKPLPEQVLSAHRSRRRHHSKTPQVAQWQRHTRRRHPGDTPLRTPRGHKPLGLLVGQLTQTRALCCKPAAELAKQRQPMLDRRRREAQRHQPRAEALRVRGQRPHRAVAVHPCLLSGSPIQERKPRQAIAIMPTIPQHSTP
jgi:hypothetical protein